MKRPKTLQIEGGDSYGRSIGGGVGKAFTQQMMQEMMKGPRTGPRAQQGGRCNFANKVEGLQNTQGPQEVNKVQETQKSVQAESLGAHQVLKAAQATPDANTTGVNRVEGLSKTEKTGVKKLWTKSQAVKTNSIKSLKWPPAEKALTNRNCWQFKLEFTNSVKKWNSPPKWLKKRPAV